MRSRAMGNVTAASGKKTAVALNGMERKAMSELRAVVYETDPCEHCDFARGFCDADFEYCQINGAPTDKLFPDILDERGCFGQ